jgi:hypothetical protein
MATQNELDNWFSYHAPSTPQQNAYTDLRSKAKELAELFNSCAPECADKTAAMRSLRSTVMSMNLTIACNEPPA